MAKSRKRLGRGLSSLMATPVAIDPETQQAAQPAAASAGPPSTEADSPEARSEDEPTVGTADGSDEQSLVEAGLTYLAVDAIVPNPHQPRQAFDEQALAQLAESIQRDGLMQPIVVRADPHHEGQYQLVAGERRWRAAQLAELPQLPALVRDLSDQQIAEWALVENLQREDLDPIERARAFRHLVDQFGLTHDQVASRVGVNRVSVSNLLRILDLETDIQGAVRRGDLTLGHAKVLLAVENPKQQARLGQRAVSAGWTVRKLEEAVRHLDKTAAGDGQGAADANKQQTGRAAHFADLEQQIGEQLQTRVRVKPGRKKGSGAITLEFYSIEQFDQLLEQLGVRVD